MATWKGVALATQLTLGYPHPGLSPPHISTLTTSTVASAADFLNFTSNS